MSPSALSATLVLAVAMLSGCEMLGIESPDKLAALRDADGRAIGGACRHAARAIEDCYVLNKKADKAAVFAGWRDMNDYMRENKIEPVVPQLVTQVAATGAKPDGDAGAAGGAKQDAKTAVDAPKPGPKAAKGHDS